MSFYQLLDIYRKQREEIEYERSLRPRACPNDGTPLEEGPGGVLFCRHDGWQYPRDYNEQAHLGM